MNIFVAFGYNPDDEWIKNLVIPLIGCFDGKVVTGEDLHGLSIPQEVENRIKGSDGVIGFLTRRDQLASGKYTTHRWVSDEITTAIAHKIPVVEVREKEVEVSGGIAFDRQRIEFELDRKAELLVELAKMLSQWCLKFKPRRFFLLPKEIVQEVRPHISKGTLKCRYRFMDGSKKSSEYETTPFRFGQGLCIDVSYVPSDEALVQVILVGPGFSWSSDYESVKLLSIILQKD